MPNAIVCLLLTRTFLDPCIFPIEDCPEADQKAFFALKFPGFIVFLSPYSFYAKLSNFRVLYYVSSPVSLWCLRQRTKNLSRLSFVILSRGLAS